jgi:hypothetical protein
MSWFRCSLYSISHGISMSDWLAPGPAATATPTNGLEDVREAMLEALRDVPDAAGGRQRTALLLRIRNAPDVHSLWALRPDVMQAVSQMHGESEGRRRLARATEKFDGLLSPAALTSARRGFRMAQTSAS